MQIRAPSTTDRLEASGNIQPWIQLFRFQEPVVRGVEFVPLGVKTRKGQAVPGRFLLLFLHDGDFAQTFAQRNRTRIAFKRGAQTLVRAFGSFVFEEQFRVEQSAINFADVFLL